MDFRGRIGVITGGATGIGNAVVRGFAARGGHAVLVDFARNAGARAAEEIRAGGGNASFLECDLRDLGQVEAIAEAVDREFGRIDGPPDPDLDRGSPPFDEPR